MKYWRLWRYKNLTFLFLSIFIGIVIARNEAFANFTENLGSAGYIGAFIGGMLFVSSFSVGTGAAILLLLTKTLSPLEIGIFAGLGGAVGDLTIFRFIKSTLTSEITPIYNKLGGDRITKMLCAKYFRWCLPIIGACIIASPFPDELGITLMGITKVKTYQFILLSLILDITGVFIFVSVFSGNVS